MVKEVTGLILFTIQSNKESARQGERLSQTNQWNVDIERLPKSSLLLKTINRYKEKNDNPPLTVKERRKMYD